MLSEFFTGTVPPRIQALAIFSSLSLLAFVIYLVRKDKLKEGYSLIWFLVGLALVLFSSVTRLLDIFAQAVGITYSPAALFLILTGGLFLLALHFSVMISKHDRIIRELAQEHALLKQRFALAVGKEVEGGALKPREASLAEEPTREKEKAKAPAAW